MKLNDNFAIEVESEDDLKALYFMAQWAADHFDKEIAPNLLGDESDLALLQHTAAKAEELEDELYHRAYSND